MNILDLIHRIGLGIGVFVLGIGLLALFVQDLAAALPLNLMVAELVAFAAIIMVLWTIRVRYRTKLEETTVPDVEYPLASRTPGDEIDNLIYRLTRLREGTIQIREQLFERLRDVATAVIIQQENCSEEQALEQLSDGSWTEDDAAASFFGAPGRRVESSIGEHLLGRFMDKESAYERQLRHTVGAIEHLGGYFHDDSPMEEAEDVQAMDPQGVRIGDEGEQISETTRYISTLLTHHWTGISAFGLAAIALGVLALRPELLLAGAIGIGMAGYARIGTAPPLSGIEVERHLSTETPEPGEEIDVTVTIENTSDTFFPDLRIIDQLPPMLGVIDGSARIATALRPGHTATFKYTVRMERGVHSWPVQVIGRDISGSIEREALIDPDVEVECVPLLKTTIEMPVRLQTSVYAGGVETKTGGEGLEFFSVRDYQPGDPKKRIDWKTYAKTGKFSTIDFRKEQAARVLLLFDAKGSSYVAGNPGDKSALNQSVDAAFDIFASLYDQGHLIGVAAFNGIPCWLGPNTGSLHLQRVRRLFVEHPALSPLPPEIAQKEEGRYVDPMVHIRRQLPGDTQIFLFSPLTDHYTYEVARRLNGAGHLVTIISPDPTSNRTIGQRIARLERAVRVKLLRDHDIRVIDWDPDDSLSVELEYAKRRWLA